MRYRHTFLYLIVVILPLGLARAGSAQTPPPTTEPPNKTVITKEVKIEEDMVKTASEIGCSDCDGNASRAGPFAGKKHQGLFKQCLNGHGLGCFAHHDQIGCSSLHSELRFIFGSCRTWFGEPCGTRPYQIPVPDAGYIHNIYNPYTNTVTPADNYGYAPLPNSYRITQP